MMEKTKMQTQDGFPYIALPARKWEQLTPREREILVLLAQGGYYREIGENLGLSVFTVRAHLHSVYKKLGVNSRGRAVAKFHEHNRMCQNRRMNGRKAVPMSHGIPFRKMVAEAESKL